MHFLIHDYDGHLPLENISRELARRGHRVDHFYFGSHETPRGVTKSLPDDPLTFTIQGIFFKRPQQKYHYLRRQWQEVIYAFRLAYAVRARHPDIVICANTPLLAMLLAVWYCNLTRTPFVYWMTDVYSVAVKKPLENKSRVLSAALGAFYTIIERHIINFSDRTAIIAEHFADLFPVHRFSTERLELVPLCAPVNRIPVCPKVNAWSEALGLDRTENIVYCGTLGLKHNPEIIASLAEHLLSRPEVRILVASSGLGADYLAQQQTKRRLSNLVLLPFQDIEMLPEVLASADILLTILEPTASRFSVPSKALTYLCAGRAQVVVCPEDNPGARVIRESHSGTVLDPTRAGELGQECIRLLDDHGLRLAYGRNGRRYAEARFDVSEFAERYERIAIGIVGARGGSATGSQAV